MKDLICSMIIGAAFMGFAIPLGMHLAHAWNSYLDKVIP